VPGPFAVGICAPHVRVFPVWAATRFDVTIQDGKVANYRVRLNISFKYDTEN
jgi:flavin-binding protein dodecin